MRMRLAISWDPWGSDDEIELTETRRFVASKVATNGDTGDDKDSLQTNTSDFCSQRLFCLETQNF